MAPLGLLVFFALPVLLRFVAGGAGWSRGWIGRVDAPLAAGLCSLAAVLIAWLAGSYLERAPYTASDFSEYCEIVDAVITGRTPISEQRSLLPAWILAPLVERLGVIDGFATLAVGCMVAIAGGVYLWAHAFGGRTAAVCAVVFLAACAPVALFARTLSFYPAIVAASVWASGATAMALRTRSTPWVVLAACAVAVAPLFDVRNVLWTAACAPLVLLAGGWRRVWLVPGFLLASWTIGGVVVPDRADGSLEQQVLVFTNDIRRLSTGAPPVDACSGEGFVWGHSDPLRVPETVACLSRLQAAMPTWEERQANGGARWARAAGPWMGLVGVSLLVVLAGMSRRRGIDQLVGLVGSLLPFALTAVSAFEDPNWRRVGAMLVPVPVLLGTAWASILESESGSVLDRLLPRGAGPGRPLTVFAAVSAVAVLLGLPYTPLAPSSAGRAPANADTEWVTLTDDTWRNRPQEARCAARIEADRRRGVPPLGVLARWWWPEGEAIGEGFPGGRAVLPGRGAAGSGR